MVSMLLLRFQIFSIFEGELPGVQQRGAGGDRLVQHPPQREVPRQPLHDARLHCGLFLLSPHHCHISVSEVSGI